MSEAMDHLRLVNRIDTEEDRAETLSRSLVEVMFDVVDAAGRLSAELSNVVYDDPPTQQAAEDLERLLGRLSDAVGEN